MIDPVRLNASELDDVVANGGKIPTALLPPSSGGSSPASGWTSLSGAGILSNASVAYGSTNTGTNQTAAVQAVLDANASSGAPLAILWDVACGVTGLKINPNTTILALPGCGAILRASSNAPLLRNATANLGVGSGVTRTLGGWTDKNITIDGGAWNSNSPAQDSASAINSTYGMVPGLRFWGVDGLTLRNLTVLSVQQYGVHLANVRRVRMENVSVDQSPMAGASSHAGHDGIHFNGPCANVRATGLRIHSGDDALAFTADDGNDSTRSPSTSGSTYPCCGAITDVVVDGLTFIDGADGTPSFYGLRLLSSASRLDDVTVKHVTGSTQGCWGIVDNFLSGSGTAQTLTAGNGNFGRITLEDIDATVTGGSIGTEYGGGLYVQGEIETLEISRRRRTNPESTAPDVYVKAGAGTVRTLTLSGFRQYATTGTVAAAAVAVAGPVDTVRFVDAVTGRDPSLAAAACPLVQTLAGAAVGRLEIEGLAADRTTVVVDHTAGTLQDVFIGGVHSNAGAGATVNVAAGLAVRNYWHPALAAATAKAGSGVVNHDNSYSETTPASAVTLTGPTSGTVSVASANFTVGLDGTPTGTVTVTPNDSSGGGAFLPTSMGLSSGSPSATFKYTPGSTGAKTIGVTNGSSLTNPSPITYTSNAGATHNSSAFTGSFANLTGYTPDTGPAWTVQNGTASVTGGLLSLDTDGANVVCDSGVADSTVTVTGVNSAGSFVLVLACSDYNNLLSCNFSGGTLTCYSVVAGSAGAGVTGPYTFAGNDTVVGIRSGNTVTIKVNGTTVASGAFNPALAGYTKNGVGCFGGGSPGTKVDSFTCA